MDGTAVLKISVHQGNKVRLNTEVMGAPNSEGWLYQFRTDDRRPQTGEFDRSIVRITVTPDAELRGLFHNAPFGLSYMPVMRHYLNKLNPRNILEWGPGRSTLMLAESLPDAQIFSIEHNPRWHERIVKLAEIYPSITPIHELITLEPGKAGKYVTAPLYLDRKFDLVFIDGRMRTDCIAIARLLLKECGAVLVHDANRTGYHQAFRFFSPATIINDTAIIQP